MAQRKGNPIGNLANTLIQTEWNVYNANAGSVGRPSKKTSNTPVRRWDVPALFNTLTQLDVGVEPTGKDPSGLDINEIRRFADEHEITRLVIETCKDQICKLKFAWSIKPKYGQTNEEVRQANEEDERILNLNRFFKSPDKENTLRQWFRILLEDLLVVDSVVIWNERTFSDTPYSMPIIDPALIKKCASESGRIPAPSLPYPDNVAYQQIIMGEVNEEFTTDDLIYYIRNPRSWAFYGYSPVEQIILTLATGMRRMAMQLSHYTEGNIPAMFLRAPKEWTVDQIKEFKVLWDALMSNTDEQAKAQMIPGDIEPFLIQKDHLKDEFDEWIARVVCYAFSVSPTAFIKNLNRSTSEQNREQADEEGLQSRKSILLEIMNLIQEKWFGYEDIEATLIESRPQDSVKQAEMDDRNIRNGSKSVDEIRRERGDAPIGAPNRIYTPNGAIPLTPDDKPLADLMDIFQQKLIKDPNDTTNPQKEVVPTN